MTNETVLAHNDSSVQADLTQFSLEHLQLFSDGLKVPVVSSSTYKGRGPSPREIPNLEEELTVWPRLPRQREGQRGPARIPHPRILP